MLYFDDCVLNDVMHQVVSKLLVTKRPHSAFRRLADAAEWVAKAAAEDQLEINGGRVVRAGQTNK
jgi:hypothetical protein